jgi:hypothetical protein
VLADDPEPNPNGPIKYRVAAAYQVGIYGFLDVWEVTNCGMPSISASFLHGDTLNKQAFYPGMFCDTFHAGPHIDMWSDGVNTNPNTGFPLMHDFAVVWTQGLPFQPQYLPLPQPYVRAHDLFIMTGNINSVPSSWLRDSLGPGAYMPDVACLSDNTISGAVDHKAQIVFYDPTVVPQNLIYTEYNRTSPPAPGTTTTSGTILDTGAFISPQIEAMSQYDASASPYIVKYEIVTSIAKAYGTFTPLWQVWGYNDVVPMTWISDMFTLASDSDSKAPCVAAGVGSAFTSDIGNTQYTPGFYPRTMTNIFDRSVDAYAGTLDSRWWQVNCATVNYHWDAARSMAVSNCSNSGFNLLTAWFNGANIVYKESPNTMAFKTTGVGHSAPKDVNVFPIPVSNVLHVEGSNNASYSITDITGKKLGSGRIDAEARLDVSSLQNGMYLLNLADETGSAQSIRFTKQ